jgi:hypothetical protein
METPRDGLMSNIHYVNRLALAPVISRLVPGWRVCSHGRWHVVRALGRPIFDWDTSVSVAFEDGGGCLGPEIDAVMINDLIVTVYAPGMLPSPV